MKPWIAMFVLSLAALLPTASFGQSADGALSAEAALFEAFVTRHGAWLLLDADAPPRSATLNVVEASPGFLVASAIPVSRKSWSSREADAEPLKRVEWLRPERGRPTVDIFDLLDQVAAPGAESVRAVLALGERIEGDAFGHLRSLLEDRLAGRAIAGHAELPVPKRLRIAAALGLGLSGEVRGLQALRIALLDPELDDELGAAVVTALSPSLSLSDAARFEECLAAATTRPLTAEAAAASLGRHLGDSDRARPALLARTVDAGMSGVSAGAAVGFWIDGSGVSTRGVGRDALVRATTAGRERVTAAMALVALAAAGDPIVQELLEAQPATLPVSFRDVALGFYGRARPAASEWCRSRLADAQRSSARVGRQLLEADGPLRPPEGRERIALGARASTFATAPFLAEVLALTGRP